ncbi:MAG: hypothetical protein LBT62_03380 [Deltaproteobacteria bacterium]|jgi:dissimilatory sulfite reductase (desulfoviridin) alpha/beta subunit|nr:hypothetical protein [Deltaproteobacteria bacterium]
MPEYDANLDLELDFSELELQKAQQPLLPGSDDSPEATHALTEAPLPVGAALAPRSILEPILDATILSSEQEHKIRPPSFFMRLGLETQSEGQSKIEKLSELAWSLSIGQNWPVFVKRLRIPQPTPTSMLKKIALAARRLADNHLCLSPTGDLDVFFNDRASLESFNELVSDMDYNCTAVVRLMACRGLLNCPMAATDALTTAERLRELFSNHRWAKAAVKRRPALTFSVAGCQAGCGLNCGTLEYTDLRLIGHRRFPPIINQNLAKLSPRISLLVSSCPGQAIFRSHLDDVTIEINPARCRRCGWCLHQDPCFSWPQPQGGYFSLELSGRRRAEPYNFVAPTTIWSEIPQDWVEVGLKLIELIELWRSEANAEEILHDFAFRKGLAGLGFTDAPSVIDGGYSPAEQFSDPIKS